MMYVGSYAIAAEMFGRAIRQRDNASALYWAQSLGWWRSALVAAVHPIIGA